MEMGLGKTVVSLSVVDYLIYQDMAINNVLIIAPKQVAKLTWQAEAAKWEHTKHLTFSVVMGTEKQRRKALAEKANIYITNREQVPWLCALFGGSCLPFGMVIIDESSSFKNHTANRFKALAKAIKCVPRVLLLTGTPAPRGYLNLWSQLYLLDNGERLYNSISSYRARFFIPGKYINGVLCDYKIQDDNNKREIENRISDICLSMRAEDYVQLPDRIFKDHRIPMPSVVKNKYEEFKTLQIMELALSGAEVTAMNAAALNGKLLQFANGAIYYDDANGVRSHEEIHDEKITRLMDIIEDAQGQSVLVAYTFQHDKERLLKALKKYKPMEMRTEKDLNDWNDGNIHVLIGHPASMGHGLNLQKGGHIAVWFGITNDLELYEQFNARLHRTGQTLPVFIHHLLMDHTIDVNVLELLKRKNDVQTELKKQLADKVAEYRKQFNKV